MEECEQAVKELGLPYDTKRTVSYGCSYCIRGCYLKNTELFFNLEGAAPCTETRACICRDCTWGNWGPWGPCSKTCGLGTKVRSRSKTGSNCIGDTESSTSCVANCISTSEYIRVAPGTRCETITSEEECKEAAKQLGLWDLYIADSVRPPGYGGGWWNYEKVNYEPWSPGCWHTGECAPGTSNSCRTILYFNENLNAVGDCSKDREQCICKKNCKLYWLNYLNDCTSRSWRLHGSEQQADAACLPTDLALNTSVKNQPRHILAKIICGNWHFCHLGLQYCSALLAVP